jgi:hypothetical protein
MSERILSEQRLKSDGRKLLRRRERCLDQIAALTAEYDDVNAELNAWLARESARFGIEVPPNVLLLDVLAIIEVQPSGAWLWRGTFNNQGTPTVRMREGGRHGSERSVARFLAEAFGLIDPEWEGILYPTNGPEDVNPWNRTLRAFPPGKVRGNPNRYGWNPTEAVS